MEEQRMFFSPLSLLLMILFFSGLLYLFFLVQINIIALAFTQIGIPGHYVFLALIATLFGSYINIPIKRIPQENMINSSTISFYGLRYMVPRWQQRQTVLAVNLGGAVIPVLVSLFLLVKTGVWVPAGLAVFFRTFVTYRLARPIPGIGIGLPPLLPPVIAALIAVIIATQQAPMVAYIAGSIGTLIGADLLNLKKIANLGAPVASIGGAGTFDGIFLNGILAVLLAALLR
jgi:uncharacterized membrane protein